MYPKLILELVVSLATIATLTNRSQDLEPANQILLGLSFDLLAERNHMLVKKTAYAMTVSSSYSS